MKWKSDPSSSFVWRRLGESEAEPRKLESETTEFGIENHRGKINMTTSNYRSRVFWLIPLTLPQTFLGFIFIDFLSSGAFLRLRQLVFLPSLGFPCA